MDEFEWDPRKGGANRRKHGVDSADATSVFEDEQALTVRDEEMRPQRKGVDFSAGRRGAVLPPPKGKTRITIRIDTDVLDWFREEVNRAGGGNYQTLMNDALRHHVEAKNENLEETLRRILRDELGRARGPRG
jgi:uncharacterized protein (DUF4415 family)